MSLYQTYRPSTLEDIRGNADIIDTLNTMLNNKEKCPHTFLLHGPTGTGKTTIARIIASRLGAKGLDINEMNSADLRGIDDIRDLISKSRFKPIESPCRVSIIDECHKLTKDAQNAFLKDLEDTPKHVYYVLCSTDPQDIIAAVKGRCTQFQMSPLTDSQMYGLLRRVIREEVATVEKEILDQIVQDSFGLPRNALVILEQVLATDPEKRLEIAKQTAAQQSESVALCRALVDGKGWKTVQGILNGLKDQNAETIRRHVLGYCQAILLNPKTEKNDLVFIIMQEFSQNTYDNGFKQVVFACYSVYYQSRK
jgi:DNA polymerase III gamma/tau subunit